MKPFCVWAVAVVLRVMVHVVAKVSECFIPILLSSIGTPIEVDGGGY